MDLFTINVAREWGVESYGVCSERDTESGLHERGLRWVEKEGESVGGVQTSGQM